MVQICRENRLTVKGWIWIFLDRNITAFDLLLLLYRPSLSLFSPSVSKTLYLRGAWSRPGRKNTLCRNQAHELHSPLINVETNQEDSFTFQTKCLQHCDITGAFKNILLHSTQIFRWSISLHIFELENKNTTTKSITQLLVGSCTISDPPYIFSFWDWYLSVWVFH